ncbi:double-strand break repair helicase AddA [Aestuariicoccus sp. MJ-SS9]|uniref:double-strand break repair helicase AddA n=1 Tax=Aestuariicoccus sp. MJ-SS9 TaxID=3079855 RepID=UPI0029102F3A|nr:double-strand break repair helicase AddA [Aestuariicoccus sp. MJ-SS9]MDU8910858.1 double-strand break repair helicase AddA [Aestuariicoccus sp. MJ-SS9]
MIPNDATLRQIQAARPDASTWLSANAGSGKTRVLTDRVARLLLEGVRPEHILCLTYTKAAASEMQNRLFKRLGSWAMLGEEALRKELDDLGVGGADLGPDALRAARTLFARAIEAPGGLRIQTIHSFCAALLRRFPLEAQVSPQFQEMEDRAAELLRADILDRMAEGPLAHLVEGIAEHLTNDTPDRFLADITRLRDAFGAMDEGSIRSGYGLQPGEDADSLLACVFLGGELDMLAGMVPDLRASGANDNKLADAIQALKGPDLAALETLEGVFLTGKSAKEPFTAKLGSVPTKGLQNGALAAVMPRFEDLMRRVEAARDTRLALAAAERDIALWRFAHTFLPLYEAEKLGRGWLDFDDLIAKARDLLSDSAVAEWVLYRLDGGIDHILVDEAQDTSPVQWQVIERLAHEFTSGSGARSDVRRTIFVVGDKKQSIYSFQGADPTEFDRMCADFRDRLKDTDAPLSQLTLEYSFRSAEPILRAVDNTFEGRVEAGFAQDQKHYAFQAEMPGRVDLWPVVETVRDDADGPWYEPVDRVGAQHHTVTLANRIAQFIRDTIGTPLPGERAETGGYAARPVHAGDFLILVRTRSRLFQEIIRACKQHELPIAGADRLRVMAELAVRDIGALLAFLATPEDDLSLATALRSPLFGLDEQTLFDLAHRRPEKRFLWEELRLRRDEFPAVLAVLDDLRDQTDFLRPYDLIERILTRHRGRRLLLGRLGDEAEDGINALLAQALAYEQTEVPSLTGFLHWMQTDDLQIKRAPDAAGHRVRVMTVHGAKGLEAPIVILPDCAKRNDTVRGDLLTDRDGVLWRQRTEDQPARQRQAIADARTKRQQEDDRLLYVAMTRAEKWLIVAAAGNLDTRNGEDWYSRVADGVLTSGGQPHPFDFADLGRGEGLRLSSGWPAQVDAAAPPFSPDAVTLPAQFLEPVTPPVEAPPVLTPSDLGGAKALPGPDNEDTPEAMRRGTLIHHLLEHLPRLPFGDRVARAPAILAAAEPDATDAPALIAEALAVLDAAPCARFFQPGTLAEVPLSAAIGADGQRVYGIVDRLIVTPDKITAVDFKTNRTIPETAAQVPEGFLRQMGAYALALSQIYPGREIETGILWTRSASYMPLPQDLVTAALGRRATS